MRYAQGGLSGERSGSGCGCVRLIEEEHPRSASLLVKVDGNASCQRGWFVSVLLQRWRGLITVNYSEPGPLPCVFPASCTPAAVGYRHRHRHGGHRLRSGHHDGLAVLRTLTRIRTPSGCRY